MQDLKEVTRDVHYENFRSQKLSYRYVSLGFEADLYFQLHMNPYLVRDGADFSDFNPLQMLNSTSISKLLCVMVQSLEIFILYLFLFHILSI